MVTGAGRGIGAAVAFCLAKAGWDLVLGDVPSSDAVQGLSYPLSDKDDLAAVAQECSELGARALAIPCDVRFGDQVDALVAAAGPGLTAAVAVAGVIAVDAPAWELTRDDLERDLDVNYHGVANLARAAVPVFLGSPTPSRCRFVAVVSSAAQRGLPRLASYVAAKHATLGYVRSLAADLAPSGVTANAVLPGSTRTQLLHRSAAAYNMRSAENFAVNQRLGRLLEPAEVASAVEWLCSHAASGTTGTFISVDGGFTG